MTSAVYARETSVMTLSVGVQSWSMQSTYMRPRPHAQLYEECVRDAQLAESLGFDSFWMGEHHFVYDGYAPSLVVAAGAILAATKTINVGSAIMLLPLHDPGRVAEGAAALADLAPGRFHLGVAAGWREIEFLGSGIDLADRGRTMDEYLTALVEGPWAERLAGTDIIVGGEAPAALRRAGRFGLPLLLAAAGPPEIQSRLAIWRENLQGDPAAVRTRLCRDVWVDYDEARIEWNKGRMAEAWRFYAGWDAEHADARKAADEAGAASAPPAEKYNSSLLIHAALGAPDEVLATLCELVDAGIDELILKVRFDGIQPSIVTECLETLATEVLPPLREHARATGSA